ncbi:sigma-70 family RNA polymerase sigma factor [Radiobacillus deserti]|uniref:Sigma-70 family RNA polymerase sigma factor n=1 Tax=Radiobacillus deserti TaxID=2594883 RepID=A0A516KCR5_9BACI|nr:sigma-70 family RNA polymerase sigma factor [Radiobacillus deserti]QDP39189.1 sigma-70 family RNA polymerase sigma factor [Radiobacillus deserti]
MQIHEENEFGKLRHQELFLKLVKTYSEEVKRIIYFYIKDPIMAEDILQDTFISCYKKLSSFRHQSSYKTWLIRIAINQSKDYLKKSYVKRIVLGQIREKPSTLYTPEYRTLQNERDKAIINQVNQLPVKQKDVILLYYYEEYDIEEIAEVLQTKQNTVKTRLYRARETLKRNLEGKDVDYEF